MKVHELIEQLKKIEPDRDVYLAVDGEGNGFSTLYNIECAAMWQGECRPEKLTPELEAQGYGEGDVAPKGSGKVIVLWP